MDSFLVLSFRVHFIASPLVICLFTVFHTIFLIHSSENADHRLEQQKDVIERVDLELFIKGTSQVLLVLVGLQEGRKRVDPAQVVED